MLRLLADENLDGAIVNGLLRRNPHLDIVRVQDVGLSGADDRDVLEWAAQTGRVVVTHDRRTMSGPVQQRIRAGETVPGVFIVPNWLPVGYAIDEILTVAECSREGEWDNVILYMPL